MHSWLQHSLLNFLNIENRSSLSHALHEMYYFWCHRLCLTSKDHIKIYLSIYLFVYVICMSNLSVYSLSFFLFVYAYMYVCTYVCMYVWEYAQMTKLEYYITNINPENCAQYKPKTLEHIWLDLVIPMSLGFHKSITVPPHFLVTSLASR